MVDDPTSALVSTMRALHPGAEVNVVRGRRRDPAASAEYVVLPNRKTPKLLVPAAPARAAAGAVRRFSADATYSDTVRRLAVSALAQGRGVSAFPDRVVVHGPREGSLAAHLDEVLGTRVVFSVGIGTERVNRKPVLQVFGADGRTVAFAKLGDSEQARADVAAEAVALSLLARRGWRRLQPPKVLHHGTWEGMELLLLSPLETVVQSPRGHSRAPTAAMTELADAFGGNFHQVAGLPWMARQHATAETLNDRRRRGMMLGCIDRLCATAGDLEWRTGSWHGDWTPWNMARSGQRVLLWDWERFETDVPIGLDRCHYLVNALTRRRGTSDETIRAGLAAAGATPETPGSPSHALGALYLLAVAGRYLPLAEGPRGNDIAPRGEQVLATLSSWLGL
jgi:hypothetical protein